MVELELQNFEKYMEERQDNFEQQMQEEWQAFKTEMEEAWQEFKTAMEEAWQQYKDEMDEAWADFKADMLQRFQTFQDAITAQQTAFEQRMQAVQQQFEDDMENRADTFEQTIADQQNAFEQNVEQELEEWKDIAIRAILDTIRQELPDLISDVIGSDFLAPIITRQGFLKMISASNETATGYLDLTNEQISVYKNGQRVSGISTLADLASIQIEPGTAIVFTRIALFSEISSGRFQYRASDFPASGYSLSVGVYVTDASITTVFEDSKYSENTQVSIENGADGFVNVTLGRTAWQDVTATLQYVTIVFKADTGTPAFTCDYSTGVELAKPPTADMVLEDQATGKRYTVEQAQGVTVDQQYNAQSANPQSGTAVAQALGTIPSVTVDQQYNAQSANAQSGVAVADAISQQRKVGSISMTIAASDTVLSAMQYGKVCEIYIRYIDTAGTNLTATPTKIADVSGIDVGLAPFLTQVYLIGGNNTMTLVNVIASIQADGDVYLRSIGSSYTVPSNARVYIKFVYIA
jgi:hypothetical protein